jgi:hypothetical protein
MISNGEWKPAGAVGENGAALVVVPIVEDLLCPSGADA